MATGKSASKRLITIFRTMTITFLFVHLHSSTAAPACSNDDMSVVLAGMYLSPSLTQAAKLSLCFSVAGSWD